MDVALAKAAIEPISAALGAGLATVLMLAFAIAWRRLVVREEDQTRSRIAALEAKVEELQPEAEPVTWAALGAKLDLLHTKANNTASDLESLDAVLVATDVLKQTVVIRRRPT